MLIKQSESFLKSNGSSCRVWEYEFETKEFGVARAVIDGRYPEQGSAMNTDCDQVYYVVSGGGTISSKKKGSFTVQPGDSYWFERNEEYYVKGEVLEFVLLNTPARSPEQYVLLD